MNDKRCRRRRSADGCGICFVAGLYVVFFQAEDGIRDGHVTGVQTCALPISNVGSLTLAALTTFVLDEADRMLDMGFQQSLDAIAGHVPLQRQTLLFSATYPDDIAAIANRITRDPITIAEIGRAHV